MNRQLVSSDEAVTGLVQHKKPCPDCPWSRKSLNGWLGSYSVDDWIKTAHSDQYIECHTLLTKQCAGLAIYRRNVCKSPRDKSILVLDKDHGKVFSSPTEFMEHHSK